MVPAGELTKRLDELFDEWLATYPASIQPGFHRDGIVHEETYLNERHRLLFVLLEPNSRDGAYDRYYGWDLRRVYGEESLAKSVTVNLARWTTALLDGCTTFGDFDGPNAQEQIRRVAVMNLKKIAGSGTADYAAVTDHGWKDRSFIREQVEIIRPTVVLACGKGVNRLLGRIMSDDSSAPFKDQVGWKSSTFVVVPANHPSVRPVNARAAFERLVEMAQAAGLAAFNSAGRSH